MKYFAAPGTTQQYSGQSKKFAPDEAIEMVGPQNAPSDVAQEPLPGKEYGTWLGNSHAEWEAEMVAAQAIMTDDIEFLWDNGVIQQAPQDVKDRYTEKKVIRNSEPA